MKFTIYQESRQGARKLNQDRVGYCYSRDALLMVVADGMGGHLHGEVAAQIAVQFLTEAFQREARTRLSNPARFLHDGITDAHHALERFAVGRDLGETPRTTCVASIVQDGIATWAHVGDSRLYHLRDGRIQAQTRDHSKVQWLVDTGRLRQEAAGRHPERNKVLNCLGGAQPPQVELSRANMLADGDSLILCSDGLWSSLTPGMMTGALASKGIRKAIPSLLDLAENRAGKSCDNLSVVAMTWADPAAVSAPPTVPPGSGEFTTEVQAFAPTQPNADAEGRVESIGQGYLSEAEIERAIADIRAAIRKRGP